MELKPQNIKQALEKVLAGKDKKKFKQSVELIINFRSIDFNKPENRINLDVVLPKGRGLKKNKVVIIGSEAVLSEAKKANAERPMLANEVANIPIKELKAIAKDHFFLAEPSAIGIVAKNWGKVLGPRSKTPKPLIGNVAKLISDTRNLVRLQTKGKNLPTVQALIGEETMNAEDLAENIDAVMAELKKKIPEGNIKSVFVKLTMGAPEKV